MKDLRKQTFVCWPDGGGNLKLKMGFSGHSKGKI
jgi:hypothetical protein